ncbi:hypothetical protein [Dinoroseobacter sp. S124A]|uniref:hypothetical protein n=1 Tax=Dinoroseobacter sp. S124A TaxID=3415128 RepID=UPI003C7D6D14
MSTPYDTFIGEVESYSALVNLKPSTVTQRAVSQSQLIERLKGGGDTSLTTMKRVRDYMAATPPSQKDAS